MHKFKIKILFIPLFFFISTATFAQSMSGSLTSLTSPYKKIVRKYTEVGKIYDMADVTTTYKWYATLHAPEFVQAVQDYAKKLYPNGPSPQAEKYLQQMRTPGQTSFFVSLYARQRGLKRMGESQDLWQSTLKVGGQSYSPIEVERVDLTPFQYRFYPYVDKWYFGYRLVFPYDFTQNPQTPVSLQLSSVGGASEVTYKNF